MTEYGHFVDQHIWVEWFDGYDKAVIRWLLNAIKRDSKSVPTVFAAPERAFGQLAKVLNKRKRGVSGSVYTAKTAPLPFISLSRTLARNDLERRWTRSKLRKLQALDYSGNRMPVPLFTLPDDTTQFSAWEQQNFPTPQILQYQVDAWAKDLRDLDLIHKLLTRGLALADLSYLDVKHPEPWNWMYRPFIWKDFQNNSTLEVTEGDERSLRYTFQFDVEAWIMMPSDPVKAVLAASMDVHDFDTDEYIQTWWMYDVRPRSNDGFIWDTVDRWDTVSKWDE